jgi:hypothetical protein
MIFNAKKTKRVVYTVRASSGEKYKRAIMRIVNTYAAKNDYNNIYALWLLVQAGSDVLSK